VPGCWSPSTSTRAWAMAILRHGQIAVTMNIYSEVSSKETREALRRLGRQLGPDE
jgi:hypothetical protein